ncbi:hypothetical protein HYW82_00690 [Candidatus Peregrinibacteria bacterium]|nr:hypothetical protein [Candidatus Peregrinibacteria bacterium]
MGESEGGDNRTLFEKVSELSDKIDLQGSDVSRTFFEENCVRCPAYSEITYDLDRGRHRIYCDLQSALLLGQVDKAANTSRRVESTFGNAHDCPPSYGGKNAREYQRLLEDTKA